MTSCLTALAVLIILPLNHFEAVQLNDVELGGDVELKCNISFYNEIHWLKMSEGRPVALMVTKLKHSGEQSVVWNRDEKRFEGFMEKQRTGLRILNISTNDLAIYYCATIYQKHFDFDKGIQLIVNNLSRGLDGLSLHYQVFAAVLSFGLLVMVLAVFLVHMKTRRKQNAQN